MSWTKRQFIEAALEEIGIGSYNFDLSPEMLQVGLKRLDAMMGAWNAKGVRIGYPIASDPTTSTIDDDSAVPDSAYEAIYLNLALRLAPVFGKQLPPDLKQNAFSSYNVMLAKNIDIPERQVNQTVPAGAGNKWRRFYSPYLTRPTDNPSDNDGEIGTFN